MNSFYNGEIFSLIHVIWYVMRAIRFRKLALWTRPIVRRGVRNRMVTKGYRKGVYERITKGTGRIVDWVIESFG